MSRRQALLNGLLRLTAKRYFARVTDPQQARLDMERACARMLRAPPGTVVVATPIGPGGAVSIRSGRGQASGKICLYFHGGGYISGSPQTHTPMVARLSRLARVECVVPRYRLAPEAPHPAAFEDAVAAWQDLRAQGYGRRDIVIGGDSAGGGLALALLAWLCESGEAPAGLIAFSPWTDLSGAGASLAQNAGRDPMLPAHRFEEAAQFYLQGAPARTATASPLFAAFPACPPVFLQCSDSEILRDDTLRMAAHLRSFGAEVTLQVWPGAPHVWQMFDGWIPEARAALAEAGAAARKMLSLPPR